MWSQQKLGMNLVNKVFTSKFKASEKYDAKIDKFLHFFRTIAFFEQAIFSCSLKKPDTREN